MTTCANSVVRRELAFGDDGDGRCYVVDHWRNWYRRNIGPNSNDYSSYCVRLTPVISPFYKHSGVPVPVGPISDNARFNPRHNLLVNV